MTEPAPPSEAPKPNAWTERARWWLLMLGTAASLLPALMMLGARWWWFAELFTHVRAQYAAGLLVSIGLAALLRGWRQVFLLIVVWLWMVAGIAPLYLKPSAPAQTTHKARLLVSNIWTPNPSAKRLVALVKRERPDVLVVLETDARWEVALSRGLPEYAHRLTARRDGHMGAVLLSRHPLAHTSVDDPPGTRSPILRAEVLLPDDQRLTVYGVHPFPPLNASLAAERDAYMAALSRRVLAERDPVVVLGDFNCTSWSPAMHDLLSGANLHDSRQGFGIQPSWPRPIDGLADWLRHIPIDHALTSSTLHVTDRRLGPDVGSDHAPVLVDVAW